MKNEITKTETGLALSEPELLKVLGSSLYPGAAPESIKLVLGYCKAAGLDPMQKPVHIVPMWDSKSGSMRDVVMPGVNLYRTQAMRGGECAGVSEPEFGPDVDAKIGGQDITHPAWCRVTVKRRLPTGEIVDFTAREFWRENYAVKGGKDKSIAPNAMWSRRPYGQIAKCAEAQALRKAFPEIASQPTADEMEGKAMRPDDAPAPDFDYLDPATVMQGVAALQTDGDAAAYWKAHAPKFTKQPADYQALKDVVIARRKAIAAEQEVRFTFAQVADMIDKAQTLDALELAGDAIENVVSEEQRTELMEKHNSRYAELEAA